MSKCAYCGKKFTRTYNSQKYCSDECREKSKREKRRIWDSKYYYSVRKKRNLKLIGSRGIGPHKNPDDNREAEIVRNEVKRLLKPWKRFKINSIRTYSNIDMNENLISNDMNFREVAKTCPYCQSEHIVKDIFKQEVYCADCGLVLEDTTLKPISTIIREDMEKYKR